MDWIRRKPVFGAGIRRDEGSASRKALRESQSRHQGAAIVRRYGERLLPELYQHLAPMSYQDALAMEKELFEELKAKGTRCSEVTDVASS